MIAWARRRRTSSGSDLVRALGLDGISKSEVSRTCDGLAGEWGTFVDKLVVAIIAGPPDVGEEGKSVRLKQAVVITTNDMNQRMRALSLESECDVDGVLRVAEPRFSAALRSGVGMAMYDGDPAVGYDEWITDVRRSLEVIDDED
jgi:hypothetical protein